MRQIPALLVLWICSHFAFAAGGHGPALLEANVTLGSKASLQRGARTFVNYCLSCHAAGYMRYHRLVEDLDLSEALVLKNLMFNTDKIGDTMTVAMRPQDAERWFGVAPPDLSVIARSRGADWLYSFLQGFYLDDSRPAGVNNLYFPDTAMPHVLWELQGVQRLVESHDEAHGGVNMRLEMAAPGTMSPSEYQQVARDLVSFLVYVGEPAKLVRYRVGFWTIAFLIVLLLATYMMKREYWKDVH
jgi:ubiquinol-cytochrome c reductase cytochrome c1 subunit